MSKQRAAPFRHHQCCILSAGVQLPCSLGLQTIGELVSELSTGAHHSAAASPEHVADPIGTDAALEALRHGPRGALFVAAVAVSLVLLTWLAFYFLLFLPRGPIG